MQSKPALVTAMRLMNLYRQQHVIFGGWDAVNKIFLDQADADVIDAIRALPVGKILVQHIENLRSGKTPIDSIAHELLPYGGMMKEVVASTNLSADEMAELESALSEFTPDQNGLDKIQSLSVVKKFGDEWQIAIRSALLQNPEISERWNTVTKTARAYYLWKVATDILAAPLSDRSRARIQADLPEYETYLPMFGETGNELLTRLRNFVSSL